MGSLSLNFNYGFDDPNWFAGFFVQKHVKTDTHSFPLSSVVLVCQHKVHIKSSKSELVIKMKKANNCYEVEQGTTYVCELFVCYTSTFCCLNVINICQAEKMKLIKAKTYTHTAFTSVTSWTKSDNIIAKWDAALCSVNVQITDKRDQRRVKGIKW